MSFISSNQETELHTKQVDVLCDESPTMKDCQEKDANVNQEDKVEQVAFFDFVSFVYCYHDTMFCSVQNNNFVFLHVLIHSSLL